MNDQERQQVKCKHTIWSHDVLRSRHRKRL